MPMGRRGTLHTLPLRATIAAFLSAVLALCAAAQPAFAQTWPPDSGRSAKNFDGWRVMPIRSQTEWNAGMTGGEGEQHPQGFTRSVSNPDILYVSHDCAQVWRSDNNGLTWRKLACNGMWVANGQSIECDPVNPDIVITVEDASSNYLAESYEGVYRSTDGGQNWTLVLRTPSVVQRMFQHCIAYDPATIGPTNASRWYVAIPSNGLYRSEDGGATWTLALSLASVATVYGIWTHPTDGQTLYMASSSGLQVSTDRGASFTTLGDLPPGTVSYFALKPGDPATMYAVMRGSGIRGLYRSTDGGQTFSLLKSFDAARVFIHPTTPNKIYLTGLNTNSLVSSNGGSSWTTVQVTPAPGLGREWKTKLLSEFCAVSPDPRDANVAVAYANACLWRTADGGLHWTDSSTLYTGWAWGWWADGVGFDVADPNRFALFCCDVSMGVTANGGDWFTRYRVPWDWYTQGLISWPGMYAGDIYPVPGSNIIVGSVGMYFDTKLVRSTDGGLNWTIVDNDSENHLFVAFHPIDPNYVFSGRKRSTDAGVTWQPIQYLVDYNASILGMSRSNPDTLYALSRPRDDILRSDDRGDTWRVYATVNWTFSPLDSKPTFAVDPANPNRIYTVDRTGDLASFDGTTWRSLGVLPLAGGSHVHNFVRMVAVDPRRPEIIYASMEASGLSQIYRTLDSGTTWEDITLNLPRVGGNGIVVHPLTGDLMSGSAYGTWFFPPPYASASSLYDKQVWDLHVMAWEVVAPHGPLGLMATDATDGFRESRLSALSHFNIYFSRAVNPATLLPGAVTIVGQSHGDQSSLVSGLTLDATGCVLTVTLSQPLPDADRYTITVTGALKDTHGQSVTGDAALTASVLRGDVDGSGRVTAADLLALRAVAGQVVTSANLRLDVDNSGSITGGDLLDISHRIGHALP